MTPSTPGPLPRDTRVGTVHLRVVDPESVSHFYQEVLGMEVLAEDAATVALAASPQGPPLLVLHAARKASPRDPRAPGLFHVAFLLPDRAALGQMIRRVQDADWSFEGFADHNVSEAAYLSDPEGNGLELYADRGRDVWRTVDGEIFLTTEPLDLDGLLSVGSEPAPTMPAGTRVGHVHLRVSSLETAEAFYGGRLGLEVMSRRYPGALFLAAGGYHHHVGVNVWDSAGRARPDRAPGLLSFELVIPDEEVRRRLTGGADEGLLMDADQIGIRICRP